MQSPDAVWRNTLLTGRSSNVATRFCATEDTKDCDCSAVLSAWHKNPIACYTTIKKWQL